MKLCVEGAVANWLYHLGAKEQATTFKTLSTLELEKLVVVMNVEKLLKKVTYRSGLFNPIKKCLWILREKFDCRATLPLNCHHFWSGPCAFDNLSKIKCPILLSLMSSSSHYNHVIVVWQSRIIYFEQKSTYPFLHWQALILLVVSATHLQESHTDMDWPHTLH